MHEHTAQTIIYMAPYAHTLPCTIHTKLHAPPYLFYTALHMPLCLHNQDQTEGVYVCRTMQVTLLYTAASLKNLSCNKDKSIVYTRYLCMYSKYHNNNTLTVSILEENSSQIMSMCGVQRKTEYMHVCVGAGSWKFTSFLYCCFSWRSVATSSFRARFLSSSSRKRLTL